MTLKSPFVVYAAAFGAVLGIYQLGWSEVYPPLSPGLLVFFGTTFLCALVLARVTQPLLKAPRYTPGLLHRYTGFVVAATFAGEIALAGGVPLLLVMNGAKFYDLEANATHLHAFVLWSVYSAIRFADFLYSYRPFYLLEAAMPVVFYGLMVYRGPALICLLAWAFIALIRYDGLIRVKHALAASVVAIGALYLNGVMGDIRSPGQESAGVPSKAFREAQVPKTFFWTYLYSTVGVANLQLSVDTLQEKQGTIPEFIAADLIPDTLSRRLMPLVNDQLMTDGRSFQSRDQLYSWKQPHVAPGLNVSTIYGRAYGFLGWYGPVIMFTVLSAFLVAYLVVIQWSPYWVPCLALVNTMVLLCIFNNMLVSAAIAPLLVLPLLLPPWQWLTLFAGQRSAPTASGSTMLPPSSCAPHTAKR